MIDQEIVALISPPFLFRLKLVAFWNSSQPQKNFFHRESYLSIIFSHYELQKILKISFQDFRKMSHSFLKGTFWLSFQICQNWNCNWVIKTWVFILRIFQIVTFAKNISYYLRTKLLPFLKILAFAHITIFS